MVHSCLLLSVFACWPAAHEFALAFTNLLTLFFSTTSCGSEFQKLILPPPHMKSVLSILNQSIRLINGFFMKNPMSIRSTFTLWFFNAGSFCSPFSREISQPSQDLLMPQMPHPLDHLAWSAQDSKSTVSFSPQAKTAQMWVYQAATQQAKDALSFFSESPSWWYHHILLASWMAPAHQGCSFGEPSARTPASFSWAIIASSSSTSPGLDHVSLSVPLYIYLCWNNWPPIFPSVNNSESWT